MNSSTLFLRRESAPVSAFGGNSKPTASVAEVPTYQKRDFCHTFIFKEWRGANLYVLAHPPSARTTPRRFLETLYNGGGSRYKT
jgi:hypothetical protein